jgi:predicted TIM-barrel enzyme
MLCQRVIFLAAPQQQLGVKGLEPPQPRLFAEAEAMAKAGADIIGCHLGLTTSGSIGSKTSVKLAGGPVSMLDDAQFILPTEIALVEQTKAVKALRDK